MEPSKEAGRHFQGVGFTAAVKSADPNALLAGAPDVFQERAKNPDQAVGELAFTHEGGEFTPEFFPRLRVRLVRYARLPLIDEGVFGGVTLEYVVDFHGVNSSE